MYLKSKSARNLMLANTININCNLEFQAGTWVLELLDDHSMMWNFCSSLGHLSGTWSNGNECILHISQSSRTRALSPEGLVSYPRQSLMRGLPFCRDAVGCILQPQLTELVYMHIFTNLSVQAGCNTKSVLSRVRFGFFV